MNKLTVEIIKNKSKIHPKGQGRIFRANYGDYILSIVGGDFGLWGDFENTFEVAVLDSVTNKFVTGFFASRGDDVLGFATIEEINEIIKNLPRKK